MMTLNERSLLLRFARGGVRQFVLGTFILSLAAVAGLYFATPVQTVADQRFNVWGAERSGYLNVHVVNDAVGGKCYAIVQYGVALANIGQVPC